MLYLITSFVVLLISIYIGIEISKVNNYLLIGYDHWIIESSLWVAMLALILLFILLYIIFRLIGKASSAAKRYHYWKISRRHSKGRALMRRGLCKLAEGEWANAEEMLIRAAKLSKRPLIDYLAAAKAAQAQQAFERRDKYLRLAHCADKNATIPIGLTQAKLQMDSKQWEQALATLQHLYQTAPNHSHVLKLLTTVYIKLQEWQKCLGLLPKVKKHKAIPEKELQPLERKVYLALLESAHHREASLLIAFWKSLPRDYKADGDFVTLYVTALLTAHQDEVAMEQIESYLKKDWRPTIVALYGKIRSDKTAHQLQCAEHWLKKHPQDPTLLLCLSTLCAEEKLWGKAKDYLQQSITIKPTLTAYVELGKLYEILNEDEKAQASFRAALNFVHIQ